MVETKRNHSNDTETHRAACRLLPRLASGKITLKVTKNGQGKHEFRQTRKGQTRDSQVSNIEASEINLLIESELLIVSIDSILIGDAGWMWLRRLKAGAEPFLEQHQIRRTDLRQVSGTIRPVVSNDGESPLGWLYRRKGRDGQSLITPEQFDAGERLRNDFERGQLAPNITSNWEGVASLRRQRRGSADHGPSLGDSALDARKRVNRALEAVGPELSGILIDVCCHLIGLSDTEKNNGWPQRSGKVILQIALSKLARHYGLRESRGENRLNDKRRISHWRDPASRPTLDKWV